MSAMQKRLNGVESAHGIALSSKDIRILFCTVASMLSWFCETASPTKPIILDLKIDNKRSLTSLEHFTGQLTIKALTDTCFENLEIKLTGTSRTYGRRVVPQAPTARTVTTAHRFLELTQPDIIIPEHRLFKAGCLYEFPFEFAVPDCMLPTTCRHAVASPNLHAYHISMPPSFGDHELGDVDDCAPRHASVEYRVAASIQMPSKTGECSEIASASEPIRFTPKERAGASCVEDWGPIRLCRAEMSLSKLWKRPSRRLVIASVHSTPFVSKDLHESVWCSELSGRVTIDLSFYPADDGAEAPRHIDFNAFLRTRTISAVSPLTQLPSDNPWFGPEIDKHTAPSIILSPQVIKNIEWVQDPHGFIRPDEDCPTYDAPPAYAVPQVATSKLCYSAQITASLNAKSAFLLVPTFHSCLITRAYDLDIRLSLPGSSIGFGPSTRIQVPAQVVAEAVTARRDSAVYQHKTISPEVGRDAMCEELGVTDLQGSPPPYHRTS